MGIADPAGSPQVLARAFGRAALQRFVPRLQGALRREVRSWCAARRPVAVYQASKALTFRMAARILLGLPLDEAQCAELAQTFEQFVENLFSLPLDVPFSGLRKVLPLWPQTFLVGLPSVCLPGEDRAPSARPTRHLCWGTWARPRVERWHGVAVGAGAGLCPHGLCDPSLSGQRWLPDFGSLRRQAPSQFAQHLPRAVPPGQASSASLDGPDGCGTAASTSARTLPRSSRDWRGVGAGFAAAAPAALLSGSENRCFLDLRTAGWAQRATRRVTFAFSSSLSWGFSLS